MSALYVKMENYKTIRKDSMLLPVQPLSTLSLVASLLAASFYHLSYKSIIISQDPPRTIFSVPMY
jgi:hypothetical protein